MNSDSDFVQWGDGEEFDTDISYLFLACNHCMCSKSRLNHWLSKFFLLHKYAKSIAVGCIKKGSPPCSDLVFFNKKCNPLSMFSYEKEARKEAKNLF